MIGRGLFLHDATQLLLLIQLSRCHEEVPAPEFMKETEELIISLLHHPEYQVVNVTLFFIQCVVTEEESLCTDDEDSTLPMNKDFCDWVHGWNKSHCGVLADKLRTSKAVGQILVKQVLNDEQFRYHECHQRTFLVVSQCPELLLGSEISSEEILRHLLDQCCEEYETISWGILMCAGALLQQNVSYTNVDQIYLIIIIIITIILSGNSS